MTGIEVAEQLRTLIVGACVILVPCHIGITAFMLARRGAEVAGGRW